MWAIRNKGAGFTSILIDAIECVRIDTQHYPLVLGLGAILGASGLLGALGADNKAPGVGAVLIAVVLVVLY